MIPQIIVTAWLTFMGVHLAETYKKEGNKTPDAVAGATLVIAIVVVALYFGNFWSVTW